MRPEPGRVLGIMQPYFFPYPGYFQLLHAVDTLVFYDDVNFIKNGWINRNRLLLDGAPAYFTAPLENSSSFAPIDEIGLARDARWRDKLAEKMRHAYARAPYYEQVAPLFRAVLDADTVKVGELAKRSVLAVAGYLGLPCRFVASSRGYGNRELKGEERVLDICLREGAAVYVNLPGGRDLYAAGRFAAHGMRLAFVVPQTFEYKQFSAPHVSHLSILDMLMFNSAQAARELIARYALTFPPAAAAENAPSLRAAGPD